MRDPAKLLALTFSEKRLLAFSLLATPFVTVSLGLFGYRRTHAALSVWPRPRPRSFPDESARLARAKSVARIVTIAAGSGPVRATCLRRSLLLWWLLRRDGIETAVKVGIHRGGDGALDAHAWVEYQGRPLNDSGDVADRFIPFERDFGAPPEALL